MMRPAQPGYDCNSVIQYHLSQGQVLWPEAAVQRANIDLQGCNDVG